MNDLLHDTMHQRADRLDPHPYDVDRMIRDGDRQVRRRRTVLVGGAASLAVAAGLGVAALLPQDATVAEPEFAAAFSAKEPVYAVGSTVHLDGRRFDVGREVFSMVQSTHGVVVTDPDGAVYASSGEETVEVGRTHARHPHLVTDGSLVAWMERDGEQPVYAVLDQATGEVVRDRLEAQPGMGWLRDEQDPALALAIDDGTVYVRDSRGLVAWDPESGAQDVLGPIKGLDVEDVKAGRILRTGLGDEVTVGKDLEGGWGMEGAWAGFALSPDASYVIGESEPDVAAVYDAVKGDEIPVDRGPYDFVVGYGWVDGDTWAGVGLRKPYDDAGIAMIACDVGGPCRTMADDVGTVEDGVVLPFGESMDE